MTDDATTLDTSQTGKTVAEVLLAMGQLMQDCHRESLALQDAISRRLPPNSGDRAGIAAFQNLDHMTQVHDDLARLLPELARALDGGTGPVDGLADALRLVSLRHRLFEKTQGAGATWNPSGEVDFF